MTYHQVVVDLTFLMILIQNRRVIEAEIVDTISSTSDSDDSVRVGNSALQ